MNIIYSIAIISLAALVHSCFQLSISVLTLLSAHTLGSGKSQQKLVKLTSGFLLGAVIMTILLISVTVLVINSTFGSNIPQILWTIACGLSLGVAIAIWLFYFQRESIGTTLWIPRNIAKYLTDRTQATKSSAEAFGLGLSSIIGEILFIIAPLLMSGLVISQFSPHMQLVGIAIYSIISLLSLLIVWVLICSGHSLGQIQKWRETNKHFLQFTAGAGLIILVFYVFVNEILVYMIGK